MRHKKHGLHAGVDLARLTGDLQSSDDSVRAKAVGSLCPCRVGWEVFEQHRETLAEYRKDPSPAVRASALHVFEDAGEMQNGGYPTNPREATDEMLRRKRMSRFRPDDEDAVSARISKHDHGRLKAKHESCRRPRRISRLDAAI